MSIQTESTAELGTQSAPARAAASSRAALLVVALAATAVVAPMWFLGNASGHDFAFHLASWMDAAGQWREGILDPRWAEWANWGFGEPRFVFYPPASWMIGAALGSMLPWAMAPGAFIWLAIVAAGMAMWKLAREWLPGPQAAAAAVFFAANPYHLVIVYYRSDFSELLANALQPLLLWGALHAAVREEWRRVPLLAMAFAAIWLSNAPAGVMATYSLVLLLAAGCVLRRSLRPLVPGGTAMAAGFGLAAAYILPAAWEQRWVQIARVVTENLRPDRNFLFTHANDPGFILFNWKVSIVALGGMLGTAIAAAFVARRRRDFPEMWWMLVALGTVSAFLMFSPSVLAWRYLPKLQFVQFPWRWLGPLDIAFAFFAAAAIGRWRKRWASWLAMILILGAIGATAAVIANDAWWDSEDVASLAEGIRTGHGYEGTDEYAPVGCDRYELPGNDRGSAETPKPPTPRVTRLDRATGRIVPAAGVRIHVREWSAERKVFAAEAAAPVTLALRLVNYPAWNIRVDGRDVRAGSRPETAEMLIPLPPGAHHVEVLFRRTWDRTVGDAISALSAIAILAFAWATRRRKMRAPPRPKICSSVRATHPRKGVPIRECLGRLFPTSSAFSNIFVSRLELNGGRGSAESGK